MDNSRNVAGGRGQVVSGICMELLVLNHIIYSLASTKMYPDSQQ